MAYYCRLYVVETLTNLRSEPDYDPQLDKVRLPLRIKYVQVLVTVLNACEVAKPSLEGELRDGQAKMEEFCLGIFANCDKSDRESPVQPPGVSLAGRFYISALFFDVLQWLYLGQLPPDLEEKRKYSKYRTLQIRNRKPLDEAPGAAQEPSPEGSNRIITRHPTQLDERPIIPIESVRTGETRRASGRINPVGGFKYADSPPGASVSTEPKSSTNFIEAKKKLQFAISSLDFSDTNGAKKFIIEALELIK
jgi:hypothetical protein